MQKGIKLSEVSDDGGSSHQIIQVKKAADVQVVGELLKLNCFWFLMKGSYQLLGRLSPGV